TAVNDFMDSVHHIWCPLFSQEFQDLPDGAETTLTYVRPERREIQLIKRLQQFVPDALPVVRKASWHCRQCHHDYYGERYCTHCQTGGFSLPRTAQQLS
ncbi:putative zinc ribbon protein, partial [Escherichia coli]|uniref:putative zinc ribbon protein n=1 Tax=Escherichia coli TaxID=562 RepID=UPI0024B70B31